MTNRLGSLEVRRIYVNSSVRTTIPLTYRVPANVKLLEGAQVWMKSNLISISQAVGRYAPIEKAQGPTTNRQTAETCGPNEFI